MAYNCGSKASARLHRARREICPECGVTEGDLLVADRVPRPERTIFVPEPVAKKPVIPRQITVKPVKPAISRKQRLPRLGPLGAVEDRQVRSRLAARAHKRAQKTAARLHGISWKRVRAEQPEEWQRILEGHEVCTVAEEAGLVRFLVAVWACVKPYEDDKRLPEPAFDHAAGAAADHVLRDRYPAHWMLERRGVHDDAGAYRVVRKAHLDEWWEIYQQEALK
jgi:hypothetical protein